MARRKSVQHYNPTRPNLWGMIRDIALASINKGQFPLAIVAAIIIVILLKLPAEDVSRLVFRILERFELMYLGGWMLSFLLVFYGIIILKHFEEINIKN